MKVFVILATAVACAHAWVILPPNPPIGIPEAPVPPSNLPEVPLPPSILPEVPQLPPGILPEVPIVPPKPELPGGRPPMIQPTVDTHVLNFPSDQDPQIRVHVNIKHESQGHAGSNNRPNYRPVRSLTFDLPNFITRPKPMPEVDLPEIGNKPELLPPPVGNLPESLPPLSPPGNLPELLPPGGNLPELLPPPEISLPTPEAPVNPDGIYTYIYPNPQQQLVKLRVQYNKKPEQQLPPPNMAPLPKPGPSPYKLEWAEIDNKLPLPEIGNKPEFLPPSILPEVPEDRPIIPMPMPPSVPKTPEVELFLDIGEMTEY